jgi:hypothetical protein
MNIWIAVNDIFFPEWIRKNVKQIVDEEQMEGEKDIHYAQFDDFLNGYVANSHPTIETHHKIADQIIAAIDTLRILDVK